MQNYGKIENGILTRAKNPLWIGKKMIANPTKELLEEYGYKPIINTEKPIKEGYYYTPIYTELSSEIIESWKENKIVEDL